MILLVIIIVTTAGALLNLLRTINFTALSSLQWIINVLIFIYFIQFLQIVIVDIIFLSLEIVFLGFVIKLIGSWSSSCCCRWLSYNDIKINLLGMISILLCRSYYCFIFTPSMYSESRLRRIWTILMVLMQSYDVIEIGYHNLLIFALLLDVLGPYLDGFYVVLLDWANLNRSIIYLLCLFTIVILVKIIRKLNRVSVSFLTANRTSVIFILFKAGTHVAFLAFLNHLFHSRNQMRSSKFLLFFILL